MKKLRRFFHFLFYYMIFTKLKKIRTRIQNIYSNGKGFINKKSIVVVLFKMRYHTTNETPR